MAGKPARVEATDNANAVLDVELAKMLSGFKLPESGVCVSSEVPQFLATESKEKKLKGKDSQGPRLSSSNVSESFSEQHENLSHPMTNSLPMILDMQQKINQMVNSQQENAENMIAAIGAEINKTMLKEIATVVSSSLAHQATPIIEQAVFSAITESFQRGIGDKPVNQLDKSVNSKIETSTARQVQAQFQTSGRQAIQEALRSSPEHTSAAQQQFGSEFSQLAHTLREVAEELAECQRRLVALEAAVVDPTILLISRLISEGKYNEAFKSALDKQDVSIVSWLCSQVDLRGLLAMNPLPMNQGVLLSLLQQLALDISKDTFRKLGWMTVVLVVINPDDPLIEIHTRPILEQVHQILQNQLNTPSSDFMAITLMMHIISSLLMRCKISSLLLRCK